MSVTYTIINLVRNEATGIVSSIQYSASKTEGEYTANILGSMRLDAPQGTPVAFEALTPAIVESWILEKLTSEEQADIENTLDSKLAFQKTPVVKHVTGLPWGE